MRFRKGWWGHLGPFYDRVGLFKQSSNWWKFSIWNRVMGSQPIRIQLGKILRENLAGKSCKNFYAGNSCGKSCGKFLRENLVGNSCKICKSSSGSAAGNAVENLAGKYSFLKPILNRFSHMTHQIEA